jgi:hypothetical protein
MKNLYLVFVLFIFFSNNILAQNNGINKQKYRVAIKKAVDEIQIDGKLTEQSWKTADKATQFLNKWPTDVGMPPLQTEVQLTYDDNYIYVAAICHEDSAEHVIQTLKRDDVIWASDGFLLMLDPVNQQTNGFAFFTNPLGVQTEGLIAADDNSDEGMSRDWDNKWFVETHQESQNVWTLEMAIPFKTLRFDASVSEWGINFLRCDVSNNAYSTWAHIPLQLNGTDLGYMGSLVWDNPPKKVNSNFSIIPYVTANATQDFEDNGGEIELGYNGGLDAKVAVTSSLNLDLTVNPDFSQVEVDQQQTNLTRFSLFFPERRTFFLENSDLFSGFGIPPLRPFFSRRIGLDGDGNAIPILGGARLSGNLTEGLRIGAMSMQTGATDDVGGQNYSVVAFQQRVFKRSSIKGIAINRQGMDGNSFDGNDYGRNAGGEFTYIAPDGQFGAWTGYHAAFSPDHENRSNYFANTGFFINTKEWDIVTSIANVGENFTTDAGFALRLYNYDAERDTTIRLGFNHWFQVVGYSFFPKSEKSLVNFTKLNLENYMVWNEAFNHNMLRNTELSFNAAFKNTSWLNIGVVHTSEELPFATNLTGDEFDNLEPGWYHYGAANIFYMSNQRKKLNYELRGSYGQFYNGTLASFGGRIRYRKQPWGNFDIAFERNILTLPENYGEARLWLVGPRIEINFNKSMFWTTFIQYNTQAENFNINSRFQWRFSPMSDLFVVYTDNYETANFGPKSRAFVVKLNYWLTI